MNSTQRSKIGIIGSVAFHIVLFFILAFAGLFNFSHPVQDDIVEVSLYGGGGGGGGNDADIEDGQDDETTTDEDVEEEDTQTDTEAIWKQDPSQPKPQVAKKHHVKKVHKGGGSGTGSGSGHGSGVGPGTGSGSGGGNGSGHGTGNGSGNGPGSGGGNGNVAIRQMPRCTHMENPVYPSAERNAGIDGTTKVRIVVGTSGRVESVSVARSSGNANLDNAAVNAAYRYRFTSAIGVNGQKVRCAFNQDITFRRR